MNQDTKSLLNRYQLWESWNFLQPKMKEIIISIKLTHDTIFATDASRDFVIEGILPYLRKHDNIKDFLDEPDVDDQRKIQVMTAVAGALYDNA